MTKRPRLSANLRRPIGVPPVAMSDIGDTKVSPALEMRIPQPDLVEPPQPTPAPGMPLQAGRGTDTLPRIFGDAVLALSLATMCGWTQGLMLQWRLSSYLMNPLPRDNHPAR